MSKALLNICVCCRLHEFAVFSLGCNTLSPPVIAGVFHDERVTLLHKRIEQVLSLRQQHEQIVRLLSPEEQDMLGVSDALTVFNGALYECQHFYSM